MCVIGSYRGIKPDTLKEVKKAVADGNINKSELQNIQKAIGKNSSSGEKQLINDINQEKFNHVESYSIYAKKGNAPVSISFLSDDSNIAIKKEASPYKLKGSKNLSSGVVYNHYGSGTASKDMRVIEFDPKSTKLEIQFNKKPGAEKSFKPSDKNFIGNQNKFIAAVNGSTFYAGQINGDEKTDNNIYTSSNRSASSQRYGIAIKNGKPEILRGGLDTKDIDVSTGSPKTVNRDKLPFFINGGALLFTANDKFKNETDFNQAFLDRHISPLHKDVNYSDIKGKKDANGKFVESFIDNMRIDTRAPRTVMGITSENKMVMVTFGDGKSYVGANGFEMYKALRNLGVVEAVMFDGGGATGMVTKDSKGQVSATSPDYNRGYSTNPNFIVIKNK